MNGVRLDKWLWAARFYKSRALASKACELGRVQLNAAPVKAAREVRVGDRLQVRNEGGEFTIDILALSQVRGPAAVAQTLYSETEESRQARDRAAAERKLLHAREPAPPSRPSKRDRRLIHQFRGR